MDKALQRCGYAALSLHGPALKIQSYRINRSQIMNEKEVRVGVSLLVGNIDHMVLFY